MRLKHLVCKRKCVENARWSGGVMRCTECNEIVALRYMTNKNLVVYVYDKFKKFRQEIEQKKDTYYISSVTDLIGNVQYEEFDQLVDNIEPIENFTPMYTFNTLEEDSEEDGSEKAQESHELEDLAPNSTNQTRILL